MNAILPLHSRTGDQALGFRKNGSPIWPIKGGSGEGDPGGTSAVVPAVVPAVDPAAAPVVDPPKPNDEELGEAGKKALKTERDARKAAEKKVADLEAAAAKPAAPANDLEAVKAEIRGEFAVTLAEAAIKGEAKGRLTDPADALLYLKAADLAGKDDAAVRKAVDKLLKDKPYLAAEPGAQPWGDVGGGNRSVTEPEPASPQERMARAYGNPKT